MSILLIFSKNQVFVLLIALLFSYSIIYLCIYLFFLTWIFFFFFWSFVFLGPYPWHMEVPRLGVKLELRLPAYTTATATWDLSHVCDLHHSHSSAGSLTHWLRPGIEPTTSWFQVRFISAASPWELRIFFFFLVHNDRKLDNYFETFLFF